MLTATIPASDRSLLTVAELRAACGVTDASKDAALLSMSGWISSALARACCIPMAGMSPATFREETLTEVMRDVSASAYLKMSRKPIVSIASIVVDGATLAAADYEHDADAGWIYRLSSDARTTWAGGKITVVYVAGWATVPDDLKLAAIKFARILWSEHGPDARRDPNLKRTEVEGVGMQEFWVPPERDTLLPAEIAGLLTPHAHRNV